MPCGNALGCSGMDVWTPANTLSKFFTAMRKRRGARINCVARRCWNLGLVTVLHRRSLQQLMARRRYSSIPVDSYVQTLFRISNWSVLLLSVVYDPPIYRCVGVLTIFSSIAARDT